VPCVDAKKKLIVLLKFMPLVLDMSYVAKYYLSTKAFFASSHMVIIILAVVMGDKLNIIITKTCQQNTNGQI
jgi:hypothetical protein